MVVPVRVKFRFRVLRTIKFTIMSYKNFLEMALTREIIVYSALDDPMVSSRRNIIVDTGSGATIGNISLFKNFKKVSGETGNINLMGAFGTGSAKPLGSILIALDIDGVFKEIKMHLVQNPNFELILGNPDIKKLRLTINEDGVFTPGGRSFGNSLQTNISRVVQGENIFKISISKTSKLSAIETGPGIFESHESGLVETDGNVPTEIKDFTVDLPTIPRPSDSKISLLERKKLINNAFNKNSMGIDQTVPEHIREKTLNLLERFCNCISVGGNDIGAVPRSDWEFRQEFTQPPTPIKVYRVSPHKKSIICEEINNLKKCGVVQNFKTDIVTTAIITVRKKDGSLRCCCDLRAVNKYTRPSNIRLSRLDDILDKLVGHNFYNSFDCAKGYWQLKIAKSQYKFFTFQCPLCLEILCFTRSVMGAKNSGLIFSQMIQSLIVGDLNECLFTYIDDGFQIINDFDSGLRVLETIFKRLAAYNMKIGLKKIKLFNKVIEAFGHKVSLEGRAPLDDRVLALKNIEIPKSKNALLSALAAYNYYRQHIRNFAQLSAELYGMTGDKSKYDQSQVDFLWSKLRDSLCDVIMLYRPDYDREFILQTDASDYGIGGVLSQEYENNNRKIVGVFSKKLTKTQSLWAIASKELYGIKMGLANFEHYLTGTPVVIETDNNCCYWLLKIRIDGVEISNKIPAVRSLLYISTFAYSVRHTKGDDPSFRLADYLSREGLGIGEKSRFIMGKNSKEALIKIKGLIEGTEEYKEVPIFQINVDRDLKPLVDRHVLGVPKVKLDEMIILAQKDSKEIRALVQNPKGKYRVRNGILYVESVRGLLLVCPKHYSETFLKYIHEMDHYSGRKMVTMVNTSDVFVYNLYKTIVNVVFGCNICGPAKNVIKGKTVARSVARPKGVFDILHVDLTLIGGLHILGVVDSFSHFVIFRALRDGTSKSIKEELLTIFCTFGLPTSVVCDNGRNLNSETLLEFYKIFGITISNSTVYNSTGNSLIELQFRRLQERTRTLGLEFNSQNINAQLAIFAYKINLEIRTERGNVSPFEIMFSRFSPWVMQIPDISQIREFSLEKGVKQLYKDSVEIRDKVFKSIQDKRDKIGDFQEKQENFLKGDKVRIRNFGKKGDKKKLFRPWEENFWIVTKRIPFTNTVIIKEIVSDVGFQPRYKKLHIKFLKKVKHFKLSGHNDYVPESVRTTYPEPSDLANEDGSRKDNKSSIKDQTTEALTNKKMISMKSSSKQKGAYKTATPGHHRMTLRSKNKNNLKNTF